MGIAFLWYVCRGAFEHAVVGSDPSLHIGVLAYFGTPTVGLHEPSLHSGEVQRPAAVAHPATKLYAVLEQIPVAESTI